MSFKLTFITWDWKVANCTDKVCSAIFLSLPLRQRVFVTPRPELVTLPGKIYKLNDFTLFLFSCLCFLWPTHFSLQLRPLTTRGVRPPPASTQPHPHPPAAHSTSSTGRAGKKRAQSNRGRYYKASSLPLGFLLCWLVQTSLNALISFYCLFWLCPLTLVITKLILRVCRSFPN